MVTREFLEQLDIKNIFFRSIGGITSVITIIDFATEKATVSCGNELPQNGILVIDTVNKNTLKKKRIELLVSSIKDFSITNTYTLFYEDPLPFDFQEKLIRLNELLKKSESRKELRYNVGLDNWKQFGLTRPDLLLTFENGTAKCIITNASIHGTLLTGSRSLIKIGDKARLSLGFEEGKVNLTGIIISAIPAADNYFRYSMRFLEPLSLLWCNHIISYGDYLDNLLL